MFCRAKNFLQPALAGSLQRIQLDTPRTLLVLQQRIIAYKLSMAYLESDPRNWTRDGSPWTRDGSPRLSGTIGFPRLGMPVSCPGTKTIGKPSVGNTHTGRISIFWTKSRTQAAYDMLGS